MKKPTDLPLCAVCDELQIAYDEELERLDEAERKLADAERKLADAEHDLGVTETRLENHWSAEHGADDDLLLHRLANAAGQLTLEGVENLPPLKRSA